MLYYSFYILKTSRLNVNGLDWRLSVLILGYSSSLWPPLTIRSAPTYCTCFHSINIFPKFEAGLQTNPVGTTAMKQSRCTYSLLHRRNWFYTLLSRAYLRPISGNQFLQCQIFLTNEANSTTGKGGRRSFALRVFAPSFTLSLTVTLSFCCPVAFGLNDQAQHPIAVKRHSFINIYSLFTSRLKFMRKGKKRFYNRYFNSFINN